MFSRAELKERAKNALRGNYWQCFLAGLVLVFIAGGGISGGFSSTASINMTNENIINGSMSVDIAPAVITAVLSIVLVMIAVGILFSIFVSNPLLVGGASFFIRTSRGECNIRELINGFTGNYKNVVKIMFLKNLYIFLWSLLFIVPGIIKAYEYYMVDYILADNPDMDSKRAFQLSRDMMYGYKWKTFVLQLSFIGWELLGALLCGIGSLFVVPYVQATMAELYRYLRQEAIKRGAATVGELGGYVEISGNDYIR